MHSDSVILSPARSIPSSNETFAPHLCERSDDLRSVALKPLRILHLYRTYFPETQGGVQEAVRQMCHATRGFGCANTIFSLAKDPVPAILRRSEALLVRSRSAFEIASCDFGLPASIWRLRALAARADLIQCHYPWPFGDVLAMLGGMHKPLVVTYHSDIVRQRALGLVYAPLQRLFFRRAAAVVATSDAYRFSSQFLKSQAGKLHTIPLSLDAGGLPPVDVERERSWRERFPDVFFLFVGVLRYYKGLNYLIDAARQTGLPVVIVGDGPERGRLMLQANGLSNVHFLGSVSDADKFALMRLSRALVFPSHLRAEAFGVSLLEASAVGRPLITTDIGTGTSYVNAHGETGLVVPPGDVVALGDAMQRLYRNELAAEQMGLAARYRCRKLFSSEVVGRAYRALYDSLLGGTP